MFLRTRASHLQELMDQPDCDEQTLRRTYRQFDQLNPWVGGWRALYRCHVRPKVRQHSNAWSVLDVGTGGGSAIRELQRCFRRDGIDARFTGIDPDARAIRFAKGQQWDGEVQFTVRTIEDLVEGGERFDLVISNHLLHHLADTEVVGFLSTCQQAAKHLVVMNDLRRHPLAYLGFRLISPLFFRRSYTVADGLVSIRRSYRPDELRQRLPPKDWSLYCHWPYRLAAVWCPDAASPQDPGRS